MPQSNINLMYEHIVADLADRAKLILIEQPELTTTEAIWKSEGEGFIYTSDKAYVVAHAFCNGLFMDDEEGHNGGDWGRELDWETIGDTLYNDIWLEVEQLFPEIIEKRLKGKDTEIDNMPTEELLPYYEQEYPTEYRKLIN